MIGFKGRPRATALAIGAVLAVAGVAAVANAQSARWAYQQTTTGGVAISCAAADTASGQACALMLCADGGDLEFVVSGLRTSPRGDNQRGEISVDRFTERTRWRYRAATNDAPAVYVAGLANPEGLATRLRRGARLSVAFEQRSARDPLAFGLSGSSRAIGSLLDRCEQTARGGPGRFDDEDFAVVEPAPRPRRPVGGQGGVFDVDCPTNRVSIEIGGNLTREEAALWRPIQASGRLVETRVRDSADGPVLECGYDVLDSVLYLTAAYPSGAGECRAVVGGFECQSAPASRYRAEGSVTLREGQQVDIDTDGGGGAPDVFLQRRGALIRALTPANGSRIALVGAEQPTRRQCREARMSDSRIELSAVRQGAYYCMRTSDNRLAWIFVRERSQRLGGASRLRFDFATWRRPR